MAAVVIADFADGFGVLLRNVPRRIERANKGNRTRVGKAEKFFVYMGGGKIPPWCGKKSVGDRSKTAVEAIGSGKDAPYRFVGVSRARRPLDRHFNRNTALPRLYQLAGQAAVAEIIGDPIDGSTRGYGRDTLRQKIAQPPGCLVGSPEVNPCWINHWVSVPSDDYDRPRGAKVVWRTRVTGPIRHRFGASRAAPVRQRVCGRV